QSAMAHADSFIAWLRTQLTADDTLIVGSLAPPRERREHRRFLAAIAVNGPGVRRGMLTSTSTDRDGVVTITDITATILDRAGVHRPDEITGRAMRVVPRAHAADDLASLERRLIHASVVRGPLLRSTVIAASVLSVLACLTMLAGRAGSAWREILATALTAIVAVPLALLIEP